MVNPIQSVPIDPVFVCESVSFALAIFLGMLEISLGRGNWDRLGRRQSSELITAQEHDVSVPELALK